MIVYWHISCICLHANEGRESKTKDSVYNTHLKLFQREKSAHYKRVNTVLLTGEPLGSERVNTTLGELIILLILQTVY